jgi:hypothetical protein
MLCVTGYNMIRRLAFATLALLAYVPAANQ